MKTGLEKISNQGNNKNKFVLFVFVLFFIFGIFFAFKSYNLVSNGVIDYAKVVDTEKRPVACGEGSQSISRDSEMGCYVYAPIVEYNMEDGSKKRFTSALATVNPPSIGKEVKIIYNHEKLEDIKIYDFKSLWLLPILLLAFSIFGILIIVLLKKERFSKRIIK